MHAPLERGQALVGLLLELLNVGMDLQDAALGREAHAWTSDLAGIIGVNRHQGCAVDYRFARLVRRCVDEGRHKVPRLFLPLGLFGYRSCLPHDAADASQNGVSDLSLADELSCH